MRAVFAFLLILSTPAFAANNKVFLTVSLSLKSAVLVKITPKGKRMELRGEILPTNATSMHLSVFRPLKMRERFQSQGGNVILKDVVLFDRNKTLRTSKLFARMKAEGQRVSGSIVMEPEFGSIVFDTIRTYGLNKTVITIAK
jgi:hypothetical protein